MSKKTIVLVSFFILTTIFIALGAQLFLFAFNPAQPISPSEPGAKLTLEITRGMTPLEVARILEQKEVITSAEKFLWLGKITRSWKKMKAGEYVISPSQTPFETLRIVTSGLSLQHPVTVREGENIYEIAEDLAAKKFGTVGQILQLCHDPQFIAQALSASKFKNPSEAPPSLEGYLYPETYYFNRTHTAEEILKQMTKKFQEVWTTTHAARAKELGFTRHQVITLASIVEKETGAKHERPLISSVFHNRLKKRMRLQSDPTTIYGIWNRYRANRSNLHKVDLLTPTNYNTYTLPGLPIGPISNPGIEAINAVLNPADSEYLFFVSHNDGTHEFTSDYKSHQNAVTKFQLDRRAREGKSWRDLNKKASSSPVTSKP